MKFAANGWWFALAAALALVAWDASVRGRHLASLSQNYGVAVDAPTRDPASPTGYALERRSLVLPTLATDARHWIVQTQAMVARGEARVRSVDYDNAPDGRDVHWASPFRGWLLALARIDTLVTGTSLPLAIERAVLWANPLVLGLLLLGATPWAARRFGGFAAALLAVGLVSLLPFAIHFYAGNADHHGAVQACVLLLSLCLIAGAQDPARARGCFVASGIFGGLGLWISAASVVPVLIGVGLGGMVHARLSRGRFSPALWRAWSVAGAVTSLLAYAIEYAPAHLGWRLEVNHPLYALAWLGGGELLCRFGRWPGRRRDLAVTIAAGAALLAAPLTIAFGGTHVFALRDPLLQSLHGELIAEFQSLPTYLAGRAFRLDVVAQWLPPIALLFLIAVAWRRQPETRLTLALALGPALVLLALTILQIRWWGLAAGLLLVAAMPGFATAARAWRVSAALVLIPGLIGTVRTAALAGVTTESDVLHLAERDVAHRLRLRAGADPLVVAAPPDGTTALIYHANARGLGTMYWENRDGLAKAAALFAAPTASRAHELIAQAGVTHVVLFSWDDTEIALARLGPPASPPAGTFAGALREGRLPAWLRPLPHPLPAHPALRDRQVRVFEVTAERSPAEIAVHAAVFAIESGRTAEANALESALAAHPGSLAAAATLAGLQARRRDEPAFRRSLVQVENLLAQADTLPLEDNVRVAMVLAIGGRTMQATAVLRAALARADERALRRLTPATLGDLLALNEALGVVFSSASLRELAAELMPPNAQRG